MYAHRSSPSFFKVMLRLFVILSLIFLLYYGYSAFHQTDPIRERLYQLGYPEKGYIVAGGVIRWDDGHLTIIQGDYLDDYPVTARQAYNIALQYLASYNAKLSKYDMSLKPKASSLSEKTKNGQRYWVFEVYLHRKGDSIFAGLIYVDRKTGLVSLKGLLG